MTAGTANPAQDLSDREILNLLRDRSSAFGRVRAIIADHAARVEQGMAQAKPLTPMAVRRLEIEAAWKAAVAVVGEDRARAILSGALEQSRG